MYILGIHTGHDAAACIFKENNLISYIKEERLTRVKGDGNYFNLRSVDEVLKIAGINKSDISAVALTRMQLPLKTFNSKKLKLNDMKRKLLSYDTDIRLGSYLLKNKSISESDFIRYSTLREALGVNENTEIIFSNHHKAHILSSFKYIDWEKDILLVSCDGGGDGAYYSAYNFDGKELVEIYGGENTLTTKPQNPGASIGLAYSYATELCGFKRNSHEGKITGLAAFGKPKVYKEIVQLFKITDDGKVESDLEGRVGLEDKLSMIFKGLSKEDIAASIQRATEEVMLKWVGKLLNITKAKYLAMSGGVFSNVKLNYELSRIDNIDEMFIFPAMGDEGLPVGACVDYLISKSDVLSIDRRRLKSIYYGFPYQASELVSLAKRKKFNIQNDNPALIAAKLLAKHKVGAIFNGRMEMGPRALGARTILANPSKRNINDSINKRLQRTEFMPFAPFVTDYNAEKVFHINKNNLYACRFMTTVAQVKDEWKDKISAVVHIDGTARPQIVYREDNPLYYDLLCEFEKATGLPVLVNTSFNAHEEPIINTPEEALQALIDGRVDFLVCTEGVIHKGLPL